MRKRSVALVVGALFLCLFAAGCGGDSDNGSSGSAAGAEGGATSTESAANTEGGAAGAESDGSGAEGDGSGGGGAESGETAEGGGGAEAASTGKAAFTAKANAICLKSNTKTKAELFRAYKAAEAKGIDSEREGKELEANVILPIVVADAEAQADGIRALDIPSGDEEQVEAILAAYQDWIDRAKQDPQKTSEAGETFSDARELAGKYPLVKCGLSPFEES